MTKRQIFNRKISGSSSYIRYICKSRTSIKFITYTYLFMSSPLAFFTFFCIVGDNCNCVSSITAEFGVGNADGTDVGVGIMGCVFGIVGSLLTICDWPKIEENKRKCNSSEYHTTNENVQTKGCTYCWHHRPLNFPSAVATEHGPVVPVSVPI